MWALLETAVLTPLQSFVGNDSNRESRLLSCDLSLVGGFAEEHARMGCLVVVGFWGDGHGVVRLHNLRYRPT